VSRQSLQIELRNIIEISNEERIWLMPRADTAAASPKWMPHPTFILLQNTNEHLAK
jgi:hypothetical protein